MWGLALWIRLRNIWLSVNTYLLLLLLPHVKGKQERRCQRKQLSCEFNVHSITTYSFVQKSKTISSEHEKLLQIRGFFLWHFHHPCDNRGSNNVIIEERLISFGEPCVFSQLTLRSLPCLGTCSLTKTGSRWVMCDPWFEAEAVNQVTRVAAAARLSFNMCALQCSHMKTVYLLPTE